MKRFLQRRRSNTAKTGVRMGHGRLNSVRVVMYAFNDDNDKAPHPRQSQSSRPLQSHAETGTCRIHATLPPAHPCRIAHIPSMKLCRQRKSIQPATNGVGAAATDTVGNMLRNCKVSAFNVAVFFGPFKRAFKKIAVATLWDPVSRQLI